MLLLLDLGPARGGLTLYGNRLQTPPCDREESCQNGVAQDQELGGRVTPRREVKPLARRKCPT